MAASHPFAIANVYHDRFKGSVAIYKPPALVATTANRLSACPVRSSANNYRLVGLKRVSAVGGTEWELFSDFVDDSAEGKIKQEILEL